MSDIYSELNSPLKLKIKKLESRLTTAKEGLEEMIKLDPEELHWGYVNFYRRSMEIAQSTLKKLNQGE